MLEYKLWIVFFFLAAIHVTACFLNFYKIRVATKPLLLIFLSVIYATSAAVFRPLVLTALLLGFAGDTLLLFGDRNKTFFFIGTAAFGAGHITYLLSLISSVDIWGSLMLLVIAFVIIFVEPLFLFIKIKDGIPSKFRYPSILYGVVITLMAAFSVTYLFSAQTTEALLIFCGMAFFVLSDSLLVYCMFGKKEQPPVYNGLIMLTYIAAQSLLTAGFILMK